MNNEVGDLRVISLREEPEYAQAATAFIQSKWPEVPPKVYEDCISHCLNSPSPLPQWYILASNTEIIGCASLVPSDCISRADLWPWLCALFIEEDWRGRGYGLLLIDRARRDCLRLGFKSIYLTTDHVGYYEKFGFKYIGTGYDLWGGEARIYKLDIEFAGVDYVG